MLMLALLTFLLDKSRETRNFIIGKKIPKLNNSNKNEINEINKTIINPLLNGLTKHNNFDVFVFLNFKMKCF